MKKAGRPAGSQNKVGKAQKDFIAGLLGETQEQFRDVFLYYAEKSSSNDEYRSKFFNYSIELSKMIVPKPIDIEGSMDVSDFQILLGEANKWNDEKE